MKYVVMGALVVVGLSGLASAGVRAGDDPAPIVEHHNSNHSLGPCGLLPCPPKPKGD
jgi:hypothetical protein